MLLFVNFNVDSCSESYYIDYVRNLNVTIQERSGFKPFKKKKVKPGGSAVGNHLLLSDYLPSFEIQCATQGKKNVLELKESILIM